MKIDWRLKCEFFISVIYLCVEINVTIISNFFLFINNIFKNVRKLLEMSLYIKNYIFYNLHLHFTIHRDGQNMLDGLN